MMRLVGAVLVLAGVLVGGRAWAQELEAPVAVDEAAAVERASGTVPLAEIKRFVGVFNAVREAYVEPVGDDELMQAAIKGLLLDLDPHSVYFDKDDAEVFDEETSGAYDGIGVEVQPQADGSILVIAPIDDTPRSAEHTSDLQSLMRIS